jgi:hypothetical protein
MKAREAQLAFEALSIEGGLLSPEWLSKVAQLQAGMQAEADYRIHKGLNLRDEIGRYWRIAQACWSDFKFGREAKADEKASAERFVLALLRDAFGFTALVPIKPAVLQERTYPIGHATLDGRVPVVVAPADSGLDSPSPTFGDGARRRSAFGLAQEYLNTQEGALWGIISDGVALRIVRDNASLTRPAWIEADLQRIFAEGRYADFAALWLLCHETRFGRQGQPVTECALESWRGAGREEGTRAREHLRRGVEEALVALGQGFLSHAENAALRAELQNGTLSVKNYFNQLLRLVYRLIFLLTVEERGLLHPEGTSDARKALYTNGYGIRRLRERSVKRSAHDRFADLWDATKVVCRGLATGEPRLGLPALAGIFAANQCPALDSAKLENRALLLAVFKLAWLREDGSLSRVNWRDMGPEELGSVYESLLELVPQIAKDGRQFAFATGGETKGNARKTTGSYYTPDSLVQMLLDSALEPVIAHTTAENPRNLIEALLGLSIIDPACGSGHFLLAAARRLAVHVARLQAGGTPSAAEYRHALRQVVGNCIFGVDMNPMAVELCKVGLWLEAVEPGLPLTFLNSHIQHGNALLGTTPELIAKGIPDGAWVAIEGDDKKTASALKKRNKKAAEGQRSLDTLWSKPSDTEAQAVTRAVAELDAASDTNVDALANKEARWDRILGSPEYRHQKFVADAWCAAFVWPKQAGALADAAPTNELWRQLRDGQGHAPALTMKTVSELADEYRFFHWHLQFPQVFAKGGFDVVLGNPPWERVKLQEKEWFAARRSDVANATNAAVRKLKIVQLEHDDPNEFLAFRMAQRAANAEAHFASASGRYAWGARGDVNTYALFAETGLFLVPTRRGQVGLLLPPGIATDDTYSDSFALLVRDGRLIELLGFINEKKLFPGVLHNFKFVLFVVGGPGATAAATCVFNCCSVEEARDPKRRFTIAAADLELLNPETKTCPVFFWRESATLTKEIYRSTPLFGAVGTWNPKFWTMFHMSNDSRLFSRTAQSDSVLLYEAKMMHQYNHRFASYGLLQRSDERTHMLPVCPDSLLLDPTSETVPFYYVSSAEVRNRVQSERQWLLGIREVTSAGLERTVTAAVLPIAGANHKIIFIQTGTDAASDLEPSLLACLNSLPLDFIARQKLGGASISGYVLRQLALPPPQAFQKRAAWASDKTVAEWILPRVLELTVTSRSLASFGEDFGYDGPPFIWASSRRRSLRAELDAVFFYLYQLPREQVEYVLSTFPVLRERELREFGEYRTLREVLEVYDAFVEAARTGRSYQTSLDPPPASARVAHASRPTTLPTMPNVVPQLAAAEDAAIVIWALLHAAGGTLTRTDLARSFALRARPDLLRQFAPVSLTQAGEWVTKVAGRSVAQGILAATLRTLADRDGVTLGVDAESQSTVSVSQNAPPEERIDPWFRFEANLALQVLRAQPAGAFKTIDASLTDDDRSLIETERKAS